MTARAHIGAAPRGRWPKPQRVSRFYQGTDYESGSWDDAGTTAAVTSGRSLTRQAVDFENEHMMGFGVLNPWPLSTGAKDWSTLDNRMSNTLAGARNKVITFALCPDWMKGGTDGSTDFSDPMYTAAPTDDATNRGHFADLCAAVAARYTDVVYFQVWNELKGMGATNGSSQFYWDAARYVALYNAVWSAVKAVRPDALIGGPYIQIHMMNSAVDSVTPHAGTSGQEIGGKYGVSDGREIAVVKYWLQNKTGADFITLDVAFGYGDSPAAPLNGDGDLGMLEAWRAWLRSLDPATYPGARDLPIWAAEWAPYSSGGRFWGDGDAGTPAKRAAVWAIHAIDAAFSGWDVILTWQPHGDQNDANGYAYPWGYATECGLPAGGTHLATGSQGQVTLMQPIAKAMRDHFVAGRPLYRPKTGNSLIYAIGSDRKALLVNGSATTQSTTGFTPAQTSMAAWSWTVVDWAPTKTTVVPPRCGDPDTFDTAFGRQWITKSAGTAISSGKASITMSTSYPEIRTGYWYSITGREAVVQFSWNAGAQTGSPEAYMALWSPSSDELGIGIIGGQMYSEVNATKTNIAGAGDGWWRIRESAGTAYWDTSTDGTTWTNRRTLAAWKPTRDLFRVILGAGFSATPGGGPWTATFDNFNTPTP